MNTAGQPADAALATELTYGTLRRRGTYDAIITAAADRTVDRIDPPVLDALRSHEGVGQDAEAAPALLMSRFGFGQSRARALLDWMRAQAWLN